MEEFIDQSMSGEREPGLIVKGRVKWQRALTSGIKKARAEEWKKKAAKTDRDRVREMAGEWIITGRAPVVDAFPEADVDDRDAPSLWTDCHTGDWDARRGAMSSEKAGRHVLP